MQVLSSLHSNERMNHSNERMNNENVNETENNKDVSLKTNAMQKRMHLGQCICSQRSLNKDTFSTHFSA